MSPVYRLVRQMDRSDRDALLAWTSSRRPLTQRFMRTVTHLGDAVFVIALVLLAVAFGNDAVERAGVHAGFTLAASHALVQILKRGVGRPRPDLPPGAALIGAPDRFSFPSGHAAAALSLALPLAMMVAPLHLAGAVLALGVLVGLSRCYLGVHYPGDVIAGWLLALAAWLAAPAVLLLLHLA